MYIAGTSWSAKNSDFDQRLIIDLGYVKNVTHIALQGRPHSNEFVTEYAISYGITDLEFADYKEPGGNIKVRGEITKSKTKKNNKTKVKDCLRELKTKKAEDILRSNNSKIYAPLLFCFILLYFKISTAFNVS